MVAANRLQWLNGQMADGREYLCGKRFTLADILLYCWLDFGALVGQSIDPANTNIKAWFDRVPERPCSKRGGAARVTPSTRASEEAALHLFVIPRRL